MPGIISGRRKLLCRHVQQPQTRVVLADPWQRCAVLVAYAAFEQDNAVITRISKHTGVLQLNVAAVRYFRNP
jgi:hypothetical protein